MINSLYEISSRTRHKIASRLNLSCFNCGWDKASCDFHHINPIANGGNDRHDNVTYICPNCHRLAHQGKLTTFISFEEKVGDDWKKFYFPSKAGIDPNKNKEIKNKVFREETRIKRKQKNDNRIHEIQNSGIDFSKFGWVEKVAPIVNLKPQKVSNWMKVFMTDFYESKCFKRKSKFDQKQLF